MDGTFNGVTISYRDDQDLSSDTSDLEGHLSGASMDTNMDTSLQSRDANGLRSRSLRLRNKIHRTPIQDKVRHKRQTLQDMARPLKQWLYQHRDNPYPTKAEKVSLALGSQMTLTQVSNWFANARRRLKNTVRDPTLTWGKRIKMYNNHVQGNAELLSISSEDSAWDSEADSQGDPAIGDYSSETTCTERTFRPKEDTKNEVRNISKDNTVRTHNEAASNFAPPAASPRTLQRDITHAPETLLARQSNKHQECSNSEQDQEQMPKYKQTILQRYLHDAYEHSFQPVQPNTPYRTRYSSGSLSSHDFEEMSTSSRSSPTVDHHYTLEDQLDEVEQALRHRHASNHSSVEDELYWKEISAAMALTNLARSRSRKLIIS